MSGIRTIILCIAVAVGLVIAAAGDYAPTSSAVYGTAIVALLAVGLYGSTHGIVVEELRENLRIVVLAVTVGVVLKVVLIAGVMLAVFRKPEYVVMAVAVAQIDPLSVAALQSETRLSETGRTILRAWAAFDDPVTVLLAIYLSTFALDVQATGDLAAFGYNLGLNALLICVAWLTWRYVRVAAARQPRIREVLLVVRSRTAAASAAIGGVVVFAVAKSLMLTVAVLGLFARPPARFDNVIKWSVQATMVLACCALGMALAGGVDWIPGLVLGAAAFGAQSVAAAVLTRRLELTDRVSLALCQQNGLTAIILSLVLEAQHHGTVAVVGPAVLTVNVLHCASNAIWHRLAPRTTSQSAVQRAGALSGSVDFSAPVKP